jgi:hypothetical protein
MSASTHYQLPPRLSIVTAAFISACAFASLAEPAAPLLSASQPNVDKSTGPRIRFAEPIFDFGKVDSGTMVKHDYIFTNIGTQTLEVTNVRPGCGCTTANTWDKTVEPGKTGTIPIQFNSAGYGGNVLKTITVSCNDPDQTNLVLQLKGTIWKPIDVNPSFAMFNIYPDTQTNETKVIRIVSNLEDPLNLSEPTCSNSTFQVALRPVKEGKEFELQVTVVPPMTNTISTPITLKTSSPKMPVLTVTAYAMVVPAIAVTPAQITLPAGPLATDTKPTITIRNNSTNSLVLSDPTLNAPGADLQLKEVQPGRVFVLSLHFPAGFEIQPGQNPEAAFKTTDPKSPLIKVPIYQVRPPPTAPATPPSAAADPNAGAARSQSVVSTAPSAPGNASPAPTKK